MEEYATVEVRMPSTLYAELDAYAVAYGYRSPDDAVGTAIQQWRE